MSWNPTWTMTRLPRRIGERAASHVIVHFGYNIIILYSYILSSPRYLSSSPPSIFTAAILSSQASCQTKEKEEREQVSKTMSSIAKLYNDLRWNVSRPQGFEAVMRVRCSQVNKEKGASRLGFSFILDKIYTCFLGSSSPRLSW